MRTLGTTGKLNCVSSSCLCTHFKFVSKLFPYRENHNLIVNGLHQLAKTANHISRAPSSTACHGSLFLSCQIPGINQCKWPIKVFRSTFVIASSLDLTTTRNQDCSISTKTQPFPFDFKDLFVLFSLAAPPSPHSIWYQLSYS